LTGEIGEFANVVKKVVRDHKVFKDKPDKERMEKLKEELTDCFIYLMILSNILKMDLEREYFKKLEYNKKKFESYK
jgi:NTP pyrophosphatase (non-canonical NTP hydrolase)